MANQGDNRSKNQPSKEAQLKGGQPPHSGNTGTSSGTMDNQREDKTSNQTGQNQGKKNQPSKEAQIKGGQHSHSGSGSNGGSTGNR